MKANCDTEDFLFLEASLDDEVEYIEDRFKIEGEISVVIVNFDVKLPKKRKYQTHKEYYKIVDVDNELQKENKKLGSSTDYYRNDL